MRTRTFLSILAVGLFTAAVSQGTSRPQRIHIGEPPLSGGLVAASRARVDTVYLLGDSSELDGRAHGAAG